MSLQELDRFRYAEVEFPTTDRTYCSKASCRRFLDPTVIEADRAICPCCGTHTCLSCKGAYHVKGDCPADFALQATLSLARQKGWQRFFACKTLAERVRGCDHME
ncbi:hypothetical protein BDV12DRAFT_161228 [Aspergillus spectabilis]